ncbi:MAG: ATP synthase F1 subunit gamma [Myxococcota bacterium]
MANLKEIKTRIGSVQKTRQITSAMKLVSGAKLARATGAAKAAQPYQEQLAGVLQRVGSAAGESVSNPLLKSRDSVKSVLFGVLTTDRGLCGGFNNNLLRRVMSKAAELRASGVKVDIVVFGRKGADFLRGRGIEVVDAIINYAKVERMDLVRPFSERAETGFVAGDYDEVWLGYNHFVNTITQDPTFQQVLPLTVEASDDGGEGVSEFEYEPSAEKLLDSLLPLYLRTLILQAFLETDAGEQAARMTAMENATRNASDLIGSLTLEYNRARQAAITTEIIEIVSGAEALKG